MAVGNFNWFLHTMLFVHTERVIEKKKQKMLRKWMIEDDDKSDSD